MDSFVLACVLVYHFQSASRPSIVSLVAYSIARLNIGHFNKHVLSGDRFIRDDMAD